MSSKRIKTREPNHRSKRSKDVGSQQMLVWLLTFYEHMLRKWVFLNWAIDTKLFCEQWGQSEKCTRDSHHTSKKDSQQDNLFLCLLLLTWKRRRLCYRARVPVLFALCTDENMDQIPPHLRFEYIVRYKNGRAIRKEDTQSRQQSVQVNVRARRLAQGWTSESKNSGHHF